MGECFACVERTLGVVLQLAQILRVRLQKMEDVSHKKQGQTRHGRKNNVYALFSSLVQQAFILPARVSLLNAHLHHQKDTPRCIKSTGNSISAIRNS